MISVLMSARLLLVVVFGVSGIAKIADFSGTRRSIIDFGLPEFLGWPVGVLLPLFELTCASALIAGGWARWGAAGVLAMLAMFLAAILVNLARGRTPECHCFGQLHSERIGWKTAVRNLVLIAISSLVAWDGSEASRASVLTWSGGLDRFEIAVFVFAAVAAFQFWFSVHLLRQNGRLMLRLEAVEAKRPAAEVPPLGLPTNSSAPDFSLTEVSGSVVTLESLNKAGKPLMLIFSDPECLPCDALLPDIAKWQRELEDRIWIGLISRGPLEANRAKATKHHIRNVLLQVDREVTSAYRVEGTPSAVLVTESLIAYPLAEGAPAIRKLVSQAISPRPISKGETVPSLRLADLTGTSLDVSTLRGRHILLLFWNPSCSFCQRLLPDLKALESEPPQGAPELLVISSGSLDANRKEGFHSRVLLDPNFDARHVFGIDGTPAAVLLDEDGLVASEVILGAKEVLALASGAPTSNLRIRSARA